MRATTAPNDIWKLTPTRLAGSSNRTTSAANAQIRIESRSRSMRIAAKTMPVMMKARCVGIAAPEIIKWLSGLLDQFVRGEKGRLGVDDSARFGAPSRVLVQTSSAKLAIREVRSPKSPER